MSKFAKTAIAAAMVMGAVVSSSAFAAGNNGTARFYGTIEDSPCSIVPDDHKLEVDMGDIGAAKLTGGGTTTPKDFQIHLQDCVFTTESNMETTFTDTNYASYCYFLRIWCVFRNCFTCHCFDGHGYYE